MAIKQEALVVPGLLEIKFAFLNKNSQAFNDST
jgi:hypothetical protein